jgi:DNA-binding NtrC family response regulator
MAISVLLVDDEEAFVQTLAKRLTLRRFNVYTASRAERLYSTLDENLIDVVVLDVKMPDLDGIEATQTIKNAYPLIEIILLTGHASLDTF